MELNAREGQFAHRTIEKIETKPGAM